MAKLSEVNVKEVTVKEFAEFIVSLEKEIPNLMSLLIVNKFGIKVKDDQSKNKMQSGCNNCDLMKESCGGNLNGICESWQNYKLEGQYEEMEEDLKKLKLGELY